MPFEKMVAMSQHFSVEYTRTAHQNTRRFLNLKYQKHICKFQKTAQLIIFNEL